MSKRFLFLAAAMVLATSAGSAMGVQYNITDLGTLGGNESHAYGINNSGQVVGWANSSTYQHAFLYTSTGGMTDLGSFSNYGASCANGINQSGQIVGDAGDFQPGYYYHAFLYTSSGGMTDIRPVGSGYSVAYAINDLGQVVGYMPTSSGWEHAFLYTSSGGMADLGTLGGIASEASGINNSGQIVGWAYNSSNDARAFLYTKSGGMTNLGALGDIRSYAYGINDGGQIVGTAFIPTNDARAFLYTSSGGMTDLGALPGLPASSADGINRSGQVVGCSYDPSSYSYYGHAFLYTCSGGMTDLNSLIDPSSQWILTYASGINDLGQIVGWGVNPSGQERAFLATPSDAPEPSTLALAIAGAAGLLAYAWRRSRTA